MTYNNIREEELKNKIAQDYFGAFDCSKIIGNIDFCVTFKKANRKPDEQSETESLLWAEAKKGRSDIYKSIVQLILTIGKARTFDKFLPSPFLGAFDSKEIAFISYDDIHDIFYINDFNWNITPSNHETKEFKLVLKKVTKIITAKSLLFNFDSDEQEIKEFIKNNLIAGKLGTSKIRIDKSNFMVIYNKWLSTVKPTIAVNWDIAKKNDIIDGDFYLADLLSRDNESLKDKLYVILKKDHYESDRKTNDMGMFISSKTSFNDGQKAHTQFWNKYERPPKEVYWEYIVERRDLLVPQDVRERKGSFFTPQIWVELSQKYIADVLGEDWQDEYYVWDCAAGTGNLLNGLTNKYNIWASTLDTQDVEVMKDRIKNGANLLEDHVFQFDFLNDDFRKLPKPLQEIINNPKKRKKLVVYINPPYAEAGSVSVTDKRKNKSNVSNDSYVWREYKDQLGLAIRELYIQFFVRIYRELKNCKLASFCKIKHINGNGFTEFRNFFNPKFKSGFLAPATSFDNVKGNFPIGFIILDLEKPNNQKYFEFNCYSNEFDKLKTKKIYIDSDLVRITEWITKFNEKNKHNVIGYTGNNGPDFQNNKYCHISCVKKINKNGSANNATKYSISYLNLMVMCIYFSVRHCIKPTWFNDRDQFLYPNDGWKNDSEFQNDCLAFTLFHSQNRVSSSEGTNHWIPFTEYEVSSHEKFDSNFMTDFIAGTLKPLMVSESLFEKKETFNRHTALKFSKEAKAVFNAGRKLWIYYHKQPNCNVNASLYDIREHFQGRNESGKMNNKSDDEQYMKLISDLRNNLKILARKIEPKIYEYEFLKV